MGIQTLILKYGACSVDLRISNFRLIYIIIAFVIYANVFHINLFADEYITHYTINHAFTERDIIKSEKELKDNYDKVVFVIGKSITSCKECKIPKQLLVTNFGISYECPDIEDKYENKHILVAVVPREYQMPSNIVIQTDKSQGEKYIVLRSANVIKTLDMNIFKK